MEKATGKETSYSKTHILKRATPLAVTMLEKPYYNKLKMSARHGKPPFKLLVRMFEETSKTIYMVVALALGCLSELGGKTTHLLTQDLEEKSSYN